MNKRTFLKTIGVISLTPLVVKAEDFRKRIYKELSNHVYQAESRSKVIVNGNESSQYSRGCGIVYNNNYLTIAHIIDFKKNISSYLGPLLESYEIKDTEVTLINKKLEKIVCDTDTDVAVYRLPKDYSLPDFPAEPATDIELGDEVYVIGDLTGVSRAKIESMEINHKPVSEVKKAQKVGIKLPRCRASDEVYLIKKRK